MRKFAILFAVMMCGILAVPKIAHADCPAGSVTITSVGTVNGSYDTLNVTDTDIAFTVSVQNTGSKRCKFYFAACLASATAVLDPSTPGLQYDLFSAGTDILNTAQATCPASGTLLGNVDSANIAKNATVVYNFSITIPAGQATTSSIYSETQAIELGIYSNQNPNKNVLLDTGPININVTTSQNCVLPATPATNSGTNATYSTGGAFGGGTINFDGAISTVDATLDNGTMTLTYTGGSCSYQAFVSVSSASGGMIQQSGATAVAGSGTFLDRIDYTARAEFCGASAQITTTGVPGISDNDQCTVNGVNATDLNLIVTTTDGTTPLLSGNYEDTLTVQIGAAL